MPALQTADGTPFQLCNQSAEECLCRQDLDRWWRDKHNQAHCNRANMSTVLLSCHACNTLQLISNGQIDDSMVELPCMQHTPARIKRANLKTVLLSCHACNILQHIAKGETSAPCKGAHLMTFVLSCVKAPLVGMAQICASDLRTSFVLGAAVCTQWGQTYGVEKEPTWPLKLTP